MVLKEESEVNPQEHLPMETTKNIKIEAVSEGLLDQDHQVKRHDIQQESLKETPRKIPTEKSKKRL
jgi:hypothetical protein